MHPDQLVDLILPRGTLSSAALPATVHKSAKNQDQTSLSYELICRRLQKYIEQETYLTEMQCDIYTILKTKPE